MLTSLRLVWLVLTALAASAAPVFAQCTVTAGGSVSCNAPTTTTATTNTNGATGSSSNQIQLWNNGTAISASTNGGITVNGFGLGLEETGGTAAAISLVNNAGNTISTNQAANPALQLSGNGGAITYSGNGSISSSTGAGIVAANPGGTISITSGGAISGGGGGNAITFTSGTATLTLQSGWSLTGNISDGGTSLTFNQSIPVTLSNVISGAGSVIQAGSGTLTLAGPNIYTGGTTINAGSTLIASNATALGTGNGASATVAAGATLKVSGAGVTIGNGLTLNGDGVGGAGALAGTGTPSVNGDVFLGSNSTIGVANAADTLTVNGAITDGSNGGFGGYSLTKVGAGTLTLTGNNNYGGGTAVTGGTLAISADNNLGLPANGLTLGAGTTLSFTGGSFTFDHATTIAGDPTYNVLPNTTITVTAAINDGGSPGSLTLTGGGVLKLTADNLYSGLTTVSDGKLALANSGSIAASSGVFLGAIGTVLDISQTTSGAMILGLTGVQGSVVSLGSQTLTVDTTGDNIFNGAIQNGGLGGGGGGSLVKQGGGSLLLTQLNFYTGPTTISAGSLALTGIGSIADSSSVAVSAGANLDISDTTAGATLNGLTGAGSVYLGGQALTVTVASNTTDTFGGIIQDSGGIGGNGPGGSLFKAGSGTLLLTGTNGYTGLTTISAGSLALTGTGSIAASSGVALSAGANLDISDTTGATIGGLTGAGSVFLGAQALTVTVASNSSDTFNGTIQDSGGIGGNGPGGSLVKAGTGSLLLTQADAYTGGTSITAGTLSVSNATALGSGGATVTSGATLNVSGVTIANALTLNGGGVGGTIDTGSGALSGTGTAGVSGPVTLGSSALIGVANAGDTLTVSGAIGSGNNNNTLVKDGAGTLTLTNPNNTYVGPTVITGGKLSLAGGGSIASSSEVAVESAGATFDISNGGNQTIGELIGNPGSLVTLGANTLTTNQVGEAPTFAGSISGTGGLTLVGGGSSSFLTLQGTNTYTGTTTIGAGTGLVLFGNGVTATGSIASTSVIDNGTLTFTHSDNIGYGGVVSGSGGVVQNGTGTTTLTGANVYSGGTTITSGTLQIGAGGTSGSIVGNVVDGGALAFDRSDTLTFAGSISGAGTLAQIGGGTLILDGNSGSFTGATTVAAGTLEVGDAADPGARLGGNVTVNAGALLRGHGTIGGNVTNAGTVYPGGSIGIMTVAGNYTQTSAGTLTIEITPNAAAGPGVGYDLLSVGGTAALAGTLSVIDDPGSYTLGSRYTIVTAAGGRSGNFASVTYNPVFTGYLSPVVSYDANDVYLTIAPTPSPVPGAPAPLFAGAQQVPDALTAMVSAVEGVGDVVLGDVCGPEAQRLVMQGSGCVLHLLADGFHSEVWMRGLGGLGSVSGGGARFGFNDDYGGMLIGTGIGLGPFTAGIGGGYLATSLNFANGSSASQNAGLGFVYGRYAQGPMWFGAMAAYGGGKVDGTRIVPGTGLAASGDRSADFGVVQARAAYDLPLGTITLEPRATLAYIHAGQAGFSETGAGLLDLSYAGTNADVTEGRLALRVMQGFNVGSWGLLPWAEAGVQETFSGLSRNVTATDGAFGAGVSGVSPAPASAVIGVGLTASATPALDVFVAYQGQFSANQTENAFSAGLAFRF